MHILMTGATGYLGSQLALELLARGHRIGAFRRESSSLERLGAHAKAIQWHSSEDPEKAFAEAVSYDAVIHAATCHDNHLESGPGLVQTNILFPLELATVAQKRGVRLFLNLHTALPPNLNAYSLSKHQLVPWLDRLAGPIRMLHAELQYFYGPNESAERFIPWLIRNCLQNRERIELTDGRQKRDFILISDAVRVLLAILEHQDRFAEKEVIPIGTGRSISIRDLAETIKKQTSSSSFLAFGAKPTRANEPAECRAEGPHLHGCDPGQFTPLEAGLAQCIELQKEKL